MMFDKFGRLAEALATTVSTSRRGFFSRVGKSALGMAGALGALGVTAAAQSGGVVCCKYKKFFQFYGGHSKETFYTFVCQPAGTTCAPLYEGSSLESTFTKSDCSKCG
jgi:hypothetical protein